MILIILGTQKFQFNRLLMIMDKLIEDKKITDQVIAQIGNSNYKPINYEYHDFFNSMKFDSLISKADVIITHGGVGSMISALIKNKKIIVVPRLKKYNEHIDDHQLELAKEFQKRDYIILNTDLSELYSDLYNIDSFEPNAYKSENKRILYEINEFISKI